MEHPRVGPRTSAPGEPGVTVSLDDLVRLQFKARGFSFLPRQPVHSLLSGRRTSKLRGRGLNFEELRQYLPGDDVRTIDWRVSARTGKPYVRVYTEERDRPVLYIVDQRSSMFFGTRRAMKSVVAAEGAALGAWRSLEQGDRVGGIVFGDEGMTELAPRRSRESVMRFLTEVANRNRELSPGPGNPAMFNEVLQRAARLVQHDALVVIISDFEGADPVSIERVTKIAAHNDVIAAFVHDPFEAGLPDAGHLVVAEGEGQLELETGDAGLRDGYAQSFQQRVARLRTLARQREIPILVLSTTEPVPDQVRTALGHHAPARTW